MSRFRNKFVAGFLVAFWLLATQHCGLEASGLFDSHADQPAGCCQSADGCRMDGCGTVENGQFRSDASHLKVATPQLTACACLLCSAVVIAEPDVEIATTPNDFLERPLDWVPTWQFVQRAALSPRAPSITLA